MAGRTVTNSVRTAEPVTGFATEFTANIGAEPICVTEQPQQHSSLCARPPQVVSFRYAERHIGVIVISSCSIGVDWP
jgi:hypothetical protein